MNINEIIVLMRGLFLKQVLIDNISKIFWEVLLGLIVIIILLISIDFRLVGLVLENF